MCELIQASAKELPPVYLKSSIFIYSFKQTNQKIEQQYRHLESDAGI